MAIIITYPLTGDQVTLTLPGAFWGEESGYLDPVDRSRTLDGSAVSYLPYLKRRKVLKWNYLTTAQKNSLEMLYSFGIPFIFADAVDPDNQFQATMISAPQFKQFAFGGWEGQMEIQEI